MNTNIEFFFLLFLQVHRVALKDNWKDIFDRIEPDSHETFFMKLAFDGKSRKPLADLNDELLNPIYGTPGWDRKYISGTRSGTPR